MKNGLTIYQSKKEWRWKIVEKGRIIASSTEGYTRKLFCERNLKSVLKHLFNGLKITSLN